MAIYRPSPMIQAVSGSIGSITFQTGPTSPIIRSKPIPRQRFAARPLRARWLSGLITQAWRDMTDAQRATWNSVALNITWPNRLGQPHRLTGRQLFFRENHLHYGFASTITTTPPLPLLTPPPRDIKLTGSSPSNLDVFYATSSATAPAFGRLYAWRPFSMNPVTPKQPLRFMSYCPFPGPSDQTLFFAAAFGTPLTGEYVTFGIRFYQTGRVWSQLYAETNPIPA